MNFHRHVEPLSTQRPATLQCSNKHPSDEETIERERRLGFDSCMSEKNAMSPSRYPDATTPVRLPDNAGPPNTTSRTGRDLLCEVKHVVNGIQQCLAACLNVDDHVGLEIIQGTLVQELYGSQYAV